MALPFPDPDAPAFCTRYPNLADASFGAQAMACSDDFFADKQRMLQPEAAVFVAGKYDTHGKWMDGWESRRKRSVGHDWCIVELARPGIVRGVDLDTSHFTGNYPPGATLEATCLPVGAALETAVWHTILPSVAVEGNRHHYHAISSTQCATHLRLNIYPDGGIARLRVYAEPVLDWSSQTSALDLAAALHGGYVVATNNQHFGLASNLLRPGRGQNMGDGWETRRRREPGNDWCIIALAQVGSIETIEVDTCHFKGNFPAACSVQAAYAPKLNSAALITQAMFWDTLLPEQALTADAQHFFASEVVQLGKISHLRLNIFPDGGVSRLRVHGRPCPV